MNWNGEQEADVVVCPPDKVAATCTSPCQVLAAILGPNGSSLLHVLGDPKWKLMARIIAGAFEAISRFVRDMFPSSWDHFEDILGESEGYPAASC